MRNLSPPLRSSSPRPIQFSEVNGTAVTPLTVHSPAHFPRDSQVYVMLPGESLGSYVASRVPMSSGLFGSGLELLQ